MANTSFSKFFIKATVLWLPLFFTPHLHALPRPFIEAPSEVVESFEPELLHHLYRLAGTSAACAVDNVRF